MCNYPYYGTYPPFRSAAFNAPVEQCDGGNGCTSCNFPLPKVYTRSFTSGQSADQASCDPFRTYMAGLSGSYRAVTLRGSNSSTGVTCSDPTIATNLCNALRTSTAMTAACDGHTWYVGDCGGPTEISVDTGSACTCATGYTMRPCIDVDDYCCSNSNWGGMNTTNCNGPGQVIDIVCW
jgi:hypothetical protein